MEPASRLEEAGAQIKQRQISGVERPILPHTFAWDRADFMDKLRVYSQKECAGAFHFNPVQAIWTRDLHTCPLDMAGKEDTNNGDSFGPDYEIPFLNA